MPERAEIEAVAAIIERWKVSGAPTSLSNGMLIRMADGREDEIRELRHGGLTYRQIADRVGVSFWAVRSVLDPRLERSAA